MKREILFRGKRVDNGEWVEGDLFRIISTNRFFITHDNSMQFEVIPETVGQFTGLTDKNGVKIFEGDICKDDYGRLARAEWSNELSAFVFNNDKWDSCCCIFESCEQPEDVEIVGNIFENPELLK